VAKRRVLDSYRRAIPREAAAIQTDRVNVLNSQGRPSASPVERGGRTAAAQAAAADAPDEKRPAAQETPEDVAEFRAVRRGVHLAKRHARRVG
jgi:hypothetical protein